MNRAKRTGRWAAIGTLLLLANCSALDAPLGSSPEKPNIVLIISDDHGYRDFGFMGSARARTPNLDRLAAQGTVFPLAYATSSTCLPSMRTLLTGLHPIQYRAQERRARSRLRAAHAPAPVVGMQLFKTLPGLLTSRGYASFMAGKFWEGSYDLAGFSEGMFAFSGAERLVRKTVKPVYDFIDRHLEEPFFLWFAPMLPHLPFDAPEEFVNEYAGVDLPAESVGYYANVSRFDAAVGALVNFLETRGLREKTLIVVVADNGWQAEGYNAQGNLRDGPRGKQSLFELGLRTPIVFNAPGWVPAGAVREGLASTVDIVPSLLAYAGAEQREGNPGVNLRPVIEGRQRIERTSLIGSMRDIRGAPAGTRRKMNGGSFLRTKEWHYIQYDWGEEALYEVSSDPGQEYDVAAKHMSVVKAFRREVRDWRKEMATGPADAT